MKEYAYRKMTILLLCLLETIAWLPNHMKLNYINDKRKEEKITKYIEGL
jgi:hypothetical protein